MSSLQRTPKADTGALPRQLYWALRVPVPSTVAATSLLPRGPPLSPLPSLFLQTLQEGWAQGDLSFGLEFTSFSFYCPGLELRQVLPRGLSTVPAGSWDIGGGEGPGQCGRE